MSKSSPIPRFIIVMMVGFGLFTITLPAVFWYRTNYYEVCPRCGLKRNVQEWRVPFTDRSYYKYYRLEESTMFNALTDLHLVDPHEHEWLLVYGTGPGSRHYFGEGLPMSQSLLKPSTGGFVRLLDRYCDQATMAYWFDCISRPKSSYVVGRIADRCANRRYENAEAFKSRLNEVVADEFRQYRYRTGLSIHEPEIKTPPRLLYQRPSR